MALLVNVLVESTCKLLHWVDQDLLSLAIHFEAFGKGLTLSLDHALASQYHVVKDLVMEHIYFTCRLIVLLENVFISFVHLLVQIVLHHGLKSLGFVTLHALQLLSLEMVLNGRKLPLSFDFIHLCHNLPTESVVELLQEGLHPDLIRRQWILGHKDHQCSFQYL